MTSGVRRLTLGFAGGADDGAVTGFLTAVDPRAARRRASETRGRKSYSSGPGRDHCNPGAAARGLRWWRLRAKTLLSRRGADTDEREELRRDARVQAQAAVGMRHGPDVPLVEAVSGRKLHPPRHRVADVVVAAPGRVAAGAGPHIIPAGPESIGTGAFFRLLAENAEAARGRRLGRDADRRGRDEQGPVPLHDIDDLLAQ